jgi:aryl-alcohol dehydrogenase-like predicted oxidoreductase
MSPRVTTRCAAPCVPPTPASSTRRSAPGCGVGARVPRGLVGRVAVGDLTGGDRSFLIDQFTSAWHVVLWTVAGLCAVSGLIVYRFIGAPRLPEEMETNMRTTPMGATGLDVPAQGLGCMRMGNSESAAVTVINRALDLGVTFLDTADMYSRGHNVEFVGRAVKNRRNEAILCTKFGIVLGHGEAYTVRGDAAYTRAACDVSLSRLGTDYIDLYYLHRRDGNVPIEETVGAMAALVAEGKVRHIGLSEVTGDELRAAHAVHPITAVQSEWSLCCRRIETMVSVCVELGVGVVPYSPNGRGLVGTDGATAMSRLARISPEYAVLPELLRDIAKRHRVTPGQVGLAWVQARAGVWGIPVTPIPGTTKVQHLEENVAALDTELDAEDLTRLDVKIIRG